MTLPVVVRRAIADRAYHHRSPVKPSSAKVSIVVRLDVAPSRIRNIGGRERQLNLTTKELHSVDPVRTTLFGNRDLHRSVRLIINRRRAYLLSVTESGHIVFTYQKFD
jgi:hypothetical protein